MQPLTRAQSAALRGLAIMAIVLHNYCHWLGQMAQENEYTFTASNVSRLLSVVASPDADLLAHVFSFFGHYGVPVFVALSAFGLVMKYEGGRYGAADPEARPWPFIRDHWRKLFVMMAVGYAAFVLVDYMTPGPRHYTLANVVGQLGMFSNLYRDPDHDIWPGPYWYFGLMVQLYVFYRLVLYRGRGSLGGRLSLRSWTMMAVLVAVVTLLAHYAFEPEGLALQWYRYNLFGSLPVFIAAILWTRRPWGGSASPTAYALTTIVATALVFFLGLGFWTWTLVPFCVCVATYSLVRALPEAWLSPLVWLGNLSAAMFVVHPVARKVLIPISRHGDLYAGLLLYIVATIVLAMVFRRVLASINK